MLTWSRAALVAAVALCVAAPAARAADGSVPMFLPVQGRLLDGADAPVNGQIAMTFSVYEIPETPTGSTPQPPLWTATYQVNVLNGIYAVQLGDTTTGQKALNADVFDGSGARWLGISVKDTPELKPRLRLASVPFALLAQRALRADDAKTLQGETPATLRDASKLTGVLPASTLGTGSAATTTVGTLTAGTWNATPVADAYVAGAAKWDAKLDTVAHDGSLTGDGKATPLAVAFGTTAGTAAAGNDARFGQLDAKFANFLPISGGTVSGALTVGSLTSGGAVGAASLSTTGGASIGGTFGVTGISQFQDVAYFQKGLSITGNASASGNGGFGGNLSVTKDAIVAGNLALGGDATIGGTVRGNVLASNRSYVGLEHDVLLNATGKYTVTQTGPATLNLPGLFDGAYDPMYSAAAPTASNPQVIQIDGLPGVHVQAGAVIGWSTRYWPATKFKIEIYDVQAGRNIWKTVADTTANPYTGLDYLSPPITDAVVSKIRLTVYETSGDSGKLGISELFFLHAEVSGPYANVMPRSETFLGYMTNRDVLMAAGQGIMKFDNVGQNSNPQVFEVQADGSLKFKRAGTIHATASADCISSTSYCQMDIMINGGTRVNALSPPGGSWAQLTASLAWTVNPGDVLSVKASRLSNIDNGSWSTLNVAWTGLE